MRIITAYSLLFFCLLFTGQKATAQKRKVDSLLTILKNDKEDTEKANHLMYLCLGYEFRGKLDEAVDYGKQALDLATKLHYLPEIAEAANYLGNVYIDKGSYPEALDYYIKSMKAAEEKGDRLLEENAKCNIGLVYFYLGDYKQALDHYKESLEMAEKAHDSNSYSTAASNIGTVYFQENDFTKAGEYFRKSLVIDEKLNYLNGIGSDLDNIGEVYSSQKKYDSAIICFKRALDIATKKHDVFGKATINASMGNAYLKAKRYDEAAACLKSALVSADSTHSADEIKSCNQYLSQLYSETGKWEDAYKTFKQYMIIKDSLVSEAKSKEIGKLEAKSDYDKQLALQKAETDKKEAVADAENKRQKIIIGFIAAIAIAVGLIALTIFRSLKTTRKQKEVIEAQKMEVEVQKTIVEEKNEEILDSITYAKRLQDAILPPFSEIASNVDCFLLYKPKNIIAGDFYWFQKKGNLILLAAADCTGHGVPGAMVSVVCCNALNRVVKEFGITEPGKILDKVRALVLETFEKSEGEIKDGMDISLCSLDISINELKWAGAYNFLLYTQNGAMKELEANKQPIGQHYNEVSFTTHVIHANKGDTFYLFTDGFADQFGGAKGKKFKYKQLQEKLLEYSTFTMEEQKNKLEKVFDDWKGNLEQTDDVCILGFRV